MSTSGPDDISDEVNIYNASLIDSSTQTVIRVYPFILEGYSDFARIKSDKKSQTALSVKPDLENSKFYSMLRYTPFPDIKEDSLRVIEIPRPRKLHFSSFAHHENIEKHAIMFSLADDDGAGYVCSEVLHRIESRFTISYRTVEIQTDIQVTPHLLNPNAVASVFIDNGAQTNINCRRHST